MIKHGKSQLSIKSFFQIQRRDSTTEPRTSTLPAPLQDPYSADIASNAPPPPTQQIERTTGRSPDTANHIRPPHRTTNTMQQRMTAFPGRPPETVPRSGTSCDLAKSYHMAGYNIRVTQVGFHTKNSTTL
jgi:hypothetical protein